MQPTTKISIFGFRLAFVVLAIYWLAIFTGTHLPGIPRAVPLPNDKGMHFTAYFFLAVLMCYTTNSTRWIGRFTVIGATAMIYGAIDELTQTFVPRRNPDLLDYAADVAGIWTAISLYAGAKYVHKTAALCTRNAKTL